MRIQWNAVFEGGPMGGRIQPLFGEPQRVLRFPVRPTIMAEEAPLRAPLEIRYIFDREEYAPGETTVKMLQEGVQVHAAYYRYEGEQAG